MLGGISRRSTVHDILELDREDFFRTLRFLNWISKKIRRNWGYDFSHFA